MLFFKRGQFAKFKKYIMFTIPENVEEVSNRDFIDLTNLKEIIIPNTVQTINSETFLNCKSLEKIEIQTPITLLDNSLCLNCTNLKEVVLPNTVNYIDSFAFGDCFKLEKINFPKGLIEIGEQSFRNCVMLGDVKIPQSVESIYDKAFLNCTSLKEINLSNVCEIGNGAFMGCVNLSKVTYSDKMLMVGEEAFKDTNLNYLYKDTKTNNFIFSKDSLSLSNLKMEYDVKSIKEYLWGFDISLLTKEKNRKTFTEDLYLLKKYDVKMPYKFYCEIKKHTDLNSFLKQNSFKFIKSEMPEFFNYLQSLNKQDAYAFFMFAKAFGCFSNSVMLDSFQTPTNVKLGPKASSALSQLLKSGVFNNVSYSNLFKNLTFNSQTNQDFIKFIMQKDENKHFENLDVILSLEKKCPGLLVKTMQSYNLMKRFKKTIDSDGVPKNRSLKETLISFYNSATYQNVEEEDKDIAEVFAQTGMGQVQFDKASYLRKYAKKQNVNEHILSKPLSEPTIMDEINSIRNKTNVSLKYQEEKMQELYNKKFTYELLSKYDPKNAVIGVYCDCCATLCSIFYGRVITESIITTNDIQNIIVKDPNGEIVGKGAMYVNRNLGYAVINDFELSTRFKEREVDNSGYYRVSKNSQQEQNREKIFDAFMRGIQDFVKAYNLENPDVPIKKVNVGMGHNRLKLQCSRFKKETKHLTVPIGYEFCDTFYEQRVLYDAENKIEENKIEEITK